MQISSIGRIRKVVKEWKIGDLNLRYDKLQQEYGAKELTSIIMDVLIIQIFVFINPMGRNIASDPNYYKIRK